MFARYPSIVGELSYRTDVEQDGKLDSRWKALMTKYPERFVVGTDTWITPRWGQVEELAVFYRRMLEELPKEVAEKIAYRNGLAMFGVK
jgi:hypothetical protein